MIAYVDESVTDKDYVIAAALINELDVDIVQYGMNILQIKGQRKIHWHTESALRRRHLVDAVTRMRWWEHLLLVRLARDSERVERQRRLCLERLWFELVARGVDTVVMECRQEAQDQADRDHLGALRARRVLHRKLSITHVAGVDEPLLACADIVAGAYRAAQRGQTDYLDEFGEKVKVIEVEPTWGR